MVMGRLDRLVQRTQIERFDILPHGPHTMFPVQPLIEREKPHLDLLPLRGLGPGVATLLSGGLAHA
jgi:hypothetical protein